MSDACHAVDLSTRPEAWADDFGHHRSQTVNVAFKPLEAAENHCLGLHRHSRLINVLPPRTLLSCHKDGLRSACELRRKDNFGDYVLFWPLAHDATRLLMSVQLAQRTHDGHQATASLAQPAPQARRIPALEKRLDQELALGDAHVEHANPSLRRSLGQGSAAIVDFSRRLPATGFDDAAKVNDSGRVQQQQIGELKSILETPLQAAHTLSEQAPQLRPVVLVIDHDEFLRRLTCRVPDAAHCDVDEAADTVEAMAALRKRYTDLSLMDVQLPGVDGIELARRLTRAPPVAGVPVIVLAGQREKHVIVDSLAAGAADFVVKPFVRDVCRRRRHARSATAGCKHRTSIFRIPKPAPGWPGQAPTLRNPSSPHTCSINPGTGNPLSVLNQLTGRITFAASLAVKSTAQRVSLSRAERKHTWTIACSSMAPMASRAP
jgi:CheY-like chemotaxis protein